MEAWIVKVKTERVLEVDPAPHRLSGTAVREIEQELQHAHRGQLRRRQRRPPVPGIPSREILVLPQPIEPIPHPHCRRTTRVTGPSYPRGELRDFRSDPGTHRHLTTSGTRSTTPTCGSLLAARRSSTATRRRFPRSPTESSLGSSPSKPPRSSGVRRTTANPACC